MNKFWKILTPIMVIIVLLLVASTIDRQGFSIVDTSSKYIEAPRFCNIKCEPTQTTAISKIMTGEFGQDSMNDESIGTPYTCKDFIGMNDGCSITLQVIDGDLTRLSSVKAELTYSVVPEGVSFSSANFDILPGGIGGYDSNEAKTFNLESNDVLWVRYLEGTGLGGWKKYDDKVKIAVTGVPYTLYKYDSLSATTGQKLDSARSGDCVLEDNYLKGLKINYHSPDISELDNVDDDAYDWTSLNMINGVYTYACGWTSVPSFASSLETYKGKEAYCLDDKMYELLDIKVGSKTYSIVNYDNAGYLGSVTCCDGDSRPGKICSDHKWINEADAECDISAGLFCPQSVYQPFGDKEYKRYVCEDNKCVEDVIEVECNKDSDCGSGDVCVRYNDPKDNSCVEQGTGGSPVCGDNKCEGNEVNTCPRDCGSAGTQTFDNTILYIVLGFVIVIFIMVVIKAKQKKGKITL